MREKAENISCAVCPLESCPDLEKAQSIWDRTPDLLGVLSRADFVTYAQPYYRHRHRLAAARARRQSATPPKD
jgi:hypothetical protein